MSYVQVAARRSLYQRAWAAHPVPNGKNISSVENGETIENTDEAGEPTADAASDGGNKDDDDDDNGATNEPGDGKDNGDDDDTDDVSTVPSAPPAEELQEP